MELNEDSCYFVPGWEFEEYEELLKKDSTGFFFQIVKNTFDMKTGTDHDTSEKRMKLMRDKFLLAGHSARWMF